MTGNCTARLITPNLRFGKMERYRKMINDEFIWSVPPVRYPPPPPLPGYDRSTNYPIGSPAWRAEVGKAERLRKAMTNLLDPLGLNRKRRKSMLKKIKWEDAERGSLYRRYDSLEKGAFFVLQNRYENHGENLERLPLNQISIKVSDGLAIDLEDGCKMSLDPANKVVLLDATLAFKESKGD
jgi:hypothetical protein